MRLRRFRRWTAILTAGLLIAITLPAAARPDPQYIARQLALLSPYQGQILRRLQQQQKLIIEIQRQLRQSALPDNLILLPMLESSYDPQAVSHAKAAGLWQLMPDTARRYGLQVDQQLDQRFDIEASTRAAVQYLTFLYRKFDRDISLTLAAYNAGEGRVSRALKKNSQATFSQLSLPAETHQYVSRYYALLDLIDVKRLGQRQPRMWLFGRGEDVLVDLRPLPPLVKL
ncbi:lytic transglycosylase domain-containing protein [Vibrio sp.]|uniref:lytic transglycosylase domain-containing protein n=1 Tax=Vibrio sp. TaxID=678 RepID=UPI003D0BB479